MATLYTNIDNDYRDVGVGTEVSPFNLEQFGEYSRTNLVDGDIFYIKGHRHIPDDETYFIEEFGSAQSTPTNISIIGWDTETRGSPIIQWDKKDGWSHLFRLSYRNVNITFQNMILNSKSSWYPSATALQDNIFNFKTVIFMTPFFKSNSSNSSNSICRYYGCTFNATQQEFTALTILEVYDCVFDGEVIIIRYLGEVRASNNITNIRDFLAGISHVGILSQYSNPRYVQIESTPEIPDFDGYVDYYTDEFKVFYPVYRVSESDSDIMRTFRTTHSYNTGLFNHERRTYGAYCMSATPPIEDTYPTSGHVGAFYFGGEYTNADTTAKAVGLKITPCATVTIDAYAYIDPVILKITPTPTATGNMNFCIDFVAKDRSDDTYPPFCGNMGNDCGCDCCTTEEHLKDYNTPVMGGNALVVDFSATTRSRGSFEGFIPTSYKWWFDYSRHPDEFVTCATSYATHTYCGGYLEDFDVRLCVDFRDEKE